MKIVSKVRNLIKSLKGTLNRDIEYFDIDVLTNPNREDTRFIGLDYVDTYKR